MKTPRRSQLALALSVSVLLPLVAPAAVASKTPAQSARAGPAASRIVLPFIDDDYPKALNEARARGVPIFIEAWAPW
jgi:hypothetical protein